MKKAHLGLGVIVSAMTLVGCGGASLSHVEVLSGNEQIAQAGTILPEPIRYRVVDTDGNGVPGVFVHPMTVGEAGRIMRTLAGVPGQDFIDTTDALGEGQFYWALGAPLGEQLTSVAAVDELGLELDGVRGVLLRAFGDLGPPSIVVVTNGNLASAEVGTLADPLTVQVFDSLANPILGVEVNWAVTAGGGTLSALMSTTDSMGFASIDLTVGPTITDNLVTATVTDRVPLEFSVIGLNPIADPLGDRVLGGGAPDLIAYGAVILDGNIVFHMRLNRRATSSDQGGPNTVVGFIEIDVDQDPATGNSPFNDVRPGGTITGMGVEYRIVIQLQGGRHQVAVLPSGVTVFSAPPAFSGRNITIRVPLSVFGGDDGNMDYAILVGAPAGGLGLLDSSNPSDWSPDSGSAVIVP